LAAVGADADTQATREQTFDEELLTQGFAVCARLRAHALAERRIDRADLDVLHVVRRPSEVCQIVDAAHERQRAYGTRQRRRASPAR
jgi:hypothetical protein